MPEKLHKKFGNGPAPPSKTPPTTSTSSATSANPNTAPKSSYKLAKTTSTPKSLAQTNGIKRSRDGSPKSPHKSTQDPKSAKTSQQSQTYDDATEERPRKSKKPNGVGPRHASSVNGSSAGHNGHRPHENTLDLKRRAAILEHKRKELPIFNSKPDIKYALRHHDILLLLGETGSGKSTQTPQFLYNEPWCKPQQVKVREKDGSKRDVTVGGMIAITQPRRVAAMTLAERVAAEMASPFGGRFASPDATVGYTVRFDNHTSRSTKIKFVTEGILLQEMLHDPNLRKYSCVIVDEIHERSVDVDLIAGFLRQIVHGDLKGRGGVPLKVVVMSATFDLGGYEAFFAKPETRPDYQPGSNYGRIIDPELADLEDEHVAASPPRSDDESFSSWEGITDSDSEAKPKEKTASKKNEPTPKSKSKTSTPKQREDNISKAVTTPRKPLPSPKVETDEELVSAISANGVAIEKVGGRAYPVEITQLLEPSPDYLHSILQIILKTHVTEPMPGDILCFLTGQDEIETLQAQLEGHSEKIKAPYPKLKAMGLYGSMVAKAQTDVFKKLEDPKIRKIVLATNIAETSVTVPGVRFVIDCGKAKVKQYRPSLGMESLLSKPISKVSAIQRAGRAGREAKGKCMRMYTADDFMKMDMDELPEILRCDVIEAVLKMKARGVEDVFNFPLMDSPDLEATKKAMLQLHSMGALDEKAALTDVGKKMASFPLPAAYGRVLIAAAESKNDVVLEVIDVIACLTSDSEIFMQPKSEDEQERVSEGRNEITRREGDIITLLTTMQRYASATKGERNEWCRSRLISDRAMKMALNIRNQLRDQCVELKLLSSKPPADPLPFEPISPERAEVLVRTFLTAFGTKTATLGQNGNYETSLGRNTIAIHPSSVLHGRKMEAIMFLENVFTAKNYAKKVSSIQADWITSYIS